jgi:hypothetical protein
MAKFEFKIHRILALTSCLVLISIPLLISIASAEACEGGGEEIEGECFGGITIEGNTKFTVKESHIITIRNKNCLESEKVESGNLSGGETDFKVKEGAGCYTKKLYAAKEHCGVAIECIKTGSEKLEIQPQEEALKEIILKC